MRGPRLVLAVLMLGALVLTLLDLRPGAGSRLDGLRAGVEDALTPARRTVATGVGSAGRALGGLPRIGGDRAVQELQRENDDLRRRLLERDGLEAQRRQVAELLALRDAGSYTTVLSEVVGVGAFQPFERTVTLDVGRRDGVSAGQAVTSGRGLVGRTARVAERTSVVVLLDDPAFSVGARLNSAPRSFGVARGRRPRGMEFSLVEMPAGSVLRPGDALVTAGSDTFVPGLPVGRLTTVDPGTGVRSATVQPYADLVGLDLLQVVVDGPRREPRVPLPAR